MVAVDTSAWYRRFASAEASGQSTCYQEWANGIADDQLILELIDELPETKRQPNLILAAARFVGIEPSPFGSFRTAFSSRWPEISTIALSKRTQTNEAGRSAVLLPVLAALPQPLALLEVGASAGLCLYPDKFSYQYGDRPRLDPVSGPGPLLRCAVEGPVPVPVRLPEVIWRAGIDVNPLDVNSQADVRWLEALIWPEQIHRREQLAAAVNLARADPPMLVAGDLNDTVAAIIARSPAAATLVVFHSAVLSYLTRSDRDAFVQTVQGTRAHWVSNEGPSVVELGDLPPSPHPAKALFVIAHDGRALAYADGHGQALYWFES